MCEAMKIYGNNGSDIVISNGMETSIDCTGEYPTQVVVP